MLATVELSACACHQMAVIVALSALSRMAMVAMDAARRWRCGDVPGHATCIWCPSTWCTFGLGEKVGSLLSLGALHLLEGHGRLRLWVQVLQVQAQSVLCGVSTNRCGSCHDLTKASRGCL